MFQRIIENVIATILSTIIVALVHRIYQWAKNGNSNQKGEIKHPIKHPKKLVHHQFFISICTLSTSLPIAFLISARGSTLLMGAKFTLFIVAGFAFIFAWGAFDAAFSFYPGDESWPE